MLRFAQEILGVVVHGWIALLCFYAACYNFVRKQYGRAAFYASVCLFECVAVYIHIRDAFGRRRR